jgi:hypothetical protein
MEASGSAESKLRDQILSRKGKDANHAASTVQLKPKVGRSTIAQHCRTDPAKLTLLIINPWLH